MAASILWRFGGSAWSTVGDLARWGAFLCDPDPEILAPKTVEQMHDLRVMVEPDWTLGWGLGIELWRRGERVFGGHTGGFPGFVSKLWLAHDEHGIYRLRYQVVRGCTRDQLIAAGGPSDGTWWRPIDRRSTSDGSGGRGCRG